MKFKINKGLWLELINVAKKEDILYYSDVAKMLNLDLGNPDDRNNKLYQELAEINRYEHERKRPLLTAVVVKMHSKPPISGQGFFDVAFELEVKKAGEDTQLFHGKELGNVYRFWRNKEIPEE